MVVMPQSILPCAEAPHPKALGDSPDSINLGVANLGLWRRRVWDLLVNLSGLGVGLTHARGEGPK